MSKIWTDEVVEELIRLYPDNTYSSISKKLNKEFKIKTTANSVRKAYERFSVPIIKRQVNPNPRILVYDIETAPIEAYVWKLWDNNVGLNMIKEDWSVLSWAAKWYGEGDVMYMDTRKKRNVRDDKSILKAIWKLLDEADIVLTQNGKKFDNKKLNARFILHGMKPPSSYRNIDTLVLAKKHFGFTSNKLEYMTDKLCSTKKSTHGKFAGFELWKGCLEGNAEAWQEMEDYNRLDVLSLEELAGKLIPWDNGINFQTYTERNECNCGSTDFKKSGFYHTNASKFQKFTCQSCGAEVRDRENLLSKSVRKNMRNATSRGR